jgi:hypothetical protein
LIAPVRRRSTQGTTEPEGLHTTGDAWKAWSDLPCFPRGQVLSKDCPPGDGRLSSDPFRLGPLLKLEVCSPQQAGATNRWRVRRNCSKQRRQN